MTAFRRSFSNLLQRKIALTLGCVIMASKAAFTCCIDTWVFGPSNSAISAERLQISRALLASPDTDATFLKLFQS